MAHHPTDVGEERARRGVGVPLSRIFVGFAVFYVCGVLLNGVRLYEDNLRMPFGKTRTFWLAAAKPVEWVSRTSRCDQFRAWVERVARKERKP